MKDQNSDRSNLLSSSLLKGVLRLIFLIVFLLTVLLLSAGRFDWWEAWAYVGQGAFVIILSRVVLIVRNPDTAMERAEAGQKPDVKSWDKILSPLTAAYLPIISCIIAGLDERYSWTPDLPDHIQVIALVIIFLGSMLGTWAMLENQFFSSHVRIQTERGHSVVSSGPYRFVRHPGYAGAIVGWVVSPVFFSSYWVVIPAVLAIFAGVLRTSLEDRTLQEELPGYREYVSKVRYRLIPGIW
jgi:protein-S-isoprenylcysteine O-methyltransferase Ste14